MHRTDDDANVANLFDAGDPSIPRQPTLVSKDWLNAVQEELCNVGTTAGVVLAKGVWNQLAGVVANLTTVQTFLVRKVFAPVAGYLGVSIDVTGAGGNIGGANGGDGQDAVKGTGGFGDTGHGGGRGANFTGGVGANSQTSGAGARAKGGAAASLGTAGVGLEAEGGLEDGGLAYAKAIHAAHGDVHVDDGKLIVDNPGSTIALENVTAATLINSWANDNGSPTFGEPAAYFKDAQGIVHLQGVVKSGANATVAFNLPAGYRPTRDRFFPQSGNATASGPWEVRIGSGLGAVAAGDVVIQFTGAPAHFPLDGISFRP